MKHQVIPAPDHSFTNYLIQPCANGFVIDKIDHLNRHDTATRYVAATPDGACDILLNLLPNVAEDDSDQRESSVWHRIEAARRELRRAQDPQDEDPDASAAYAAQCFELYGNSGNPGHLIVASAALFNTICAPNIYENLDLARGDAYGQTIDNVTRLAPRNQPPHGGAA